MAIEGLSIGDAFGERFFTHFTALAHLWAQGKTDPALIRQIDLGPPPWHWTDDTAMAISIVATLQGYGVIDEYDLARHFALAHADEPRRGYGPGMHTLLPRLRWPGAWEATPLVGRRSRPPVELVAKTRATPKYKQRRSVTQRATTGAL